MNRLTKFYINEKRNLINREIIPYGVKMAGAPLVWRETAGRGIKVGVIDTGIDINHYDLKDRIKKYKDFTGEGIFDYNGHGTHICGTIAASRNNLGIVGVAPECDLYMAKAFTKEGSCEEKNVINALKWLILENVDIINMSFSAEEYTSNYYNAVKAAYNKGIILVAAAGNEGEKGIGYPAKFDETICVGAVDIKRQRPYFSSVGTRIDVTAAGTDILSTYPGNKYAVLSGTSMATSIISGVIALLQGKAMIRLKRKLKPDEVKLSIKIYSDDLSSHRKVELNTV